jgi:Tol biopolymer transport system component
MVNRFYLFGVIAVASLFLIAPPASPDDSQKEPGEGQFLDRVRPLTYQGARAGEAYFSPDGGSLIFQSERDPENPFFQIHMMSLADGETHRVSSGIGKTTCSFFRPGTDEVLFASTHLDPNALQKQKDEIEARAAGKQKRYSWDYDETYDIFVSRRDGSGVTRLTEALGYDAEGAYSPDGGKIIFCSMRDAYPPDRLSAEDRERLEVDPSYFGEIYIMNADGTDATRLTEWPGYDGGPFFSPDGNGIVWRHFDESGALADVYTMRLDGSDRRRLTDFESMCWAPFYHPSGKYVIFTTNKLGYSNFELYMVDTAGAKEPVRVTFTEGFDGLPVFSPDGRQLAWTSNRTPSKKSQIFLGNWDHDAAVAALRASPSRGADQGMSPQILAADMQAAVQYLASDDLEGRMTGSDGTRMAADYIAAQLGGADVDPLGDNGSYFQEFPFTSGVEIAPDGNLLVVLDKDDPERGRPYSLDKDFRPLAFTSDGEVEGSVVFAGYGLMLSADAEKPYDSYRGLDVKDKIVMVLRYVPEEVEPERRAELNLHARVRYKALLAREAGAKALLVVTGPNSPNAGELMPLKVDRSMTSAGIVVASIAQDLAEAILASADKDLQDVQDNLDLENPHFESTFDIPSVTIRVAAGVKRVKTTGRNVIGVIPPADQVERKEYVVIGAHYDHIGHGEIGSLARKGEEGQIHNGADDNASGTAVVLEIAAALAEARKSGPTDFRRGVIVALWSGEELGLIGSTYFAENPPIDLRNVVAYLNFDMVGRLSKNRLIVQGVGSSPRWTELAEKNNITAAFDLVLQQDPYLPTDASAFYPKEIPVISFFTGVHEDYNRPTDDWQTLDYDGMEQIAMFASALVTDVVKGPEPPEYAKVERRKEKSAGRGGVRVYLGTIPDYAGGGEIEGLKLTGVRAGGPADKAGLMGGDIIVEFGGKKIMDIYDYTYALDAVKVGSEVTVIVLRNGERITMTVIPEARK